MLAGLLEDAQGTTFKPSHCNKQGKRYRYYVSPDISLPAHEIEALVIGEITAFLCKHSSLAQILKQEDTSELTAMLTRADTLATKLRTNPVRTDLKRITSKIVIAPDQFAIHLNLNGLSHVICNENPEESGPHAQGDAPHIITRTINLKRSGQGKRIILGSEKSKNGKADPVLLKSIAQAHIWFDDLKAGNSYKIIAKENNIDQRHVARIIRLAFLAPDIVEAIIQGREPRGLTAEQLLRLPAFPVDWQEQQKLLGFI